MRTRSTILFGLTLSLILVAGVAGWQLRFPLHQLARLAWSKVKAPPSVTFAVVGDNHGDNPTYRQILQELPAYHPAFLVNLADLTDQGSNQEFQAIHDLEQPLPFPVYHTVGNHDIKTDPTRHLFIQVFHQSPWQSYDAGQVHLVILDNADRKVGFPAASLDWLAKDLTAHQGQTIFVAYHRPFDLPLARLLGDDETTASAKTNQRLVELVQRYHVRYILTAHLHTYLTYSLAGIPAVVSGGGGGEAQAILGGPSHNYFHYLIVTVQGSNISVTVHRITITS